jgi:hypothetical protein
MPFTTSSLEALPHLQPAAAALQASHPDLRIDAALSARGWTIALLGGGSLTLAQARFPSAARADAFLGRLAAACGRAVPPRAGRTRVAPAADSRGAIALVDGAFVYLAKREVPERGRMICWP